MLQKVAVCGQTWQQLPNAKIFLFFLKEVFQLLLGHACFELIKALMTNCEFREMGCIHQTG